MKKILLCTPYKKEQFYVQGGLVIWGANLLNYYYDLKDTSIQIIPISFDRKTFTQNKMSKFRRIITGINELKHSIITTLQYLINQKVDVIHLCTSGSLSLIKDYFILKVAKRKGIKSVIHFHFGRIPELLKTDGFWGGVLKKIVRLADVCVTMDNFSYKALLDNRYNNVVNIPNPLSPSIINLVDSLQGKYNRIPNRILFVGHVVQTKGVYEMVEACGSLSNIELRIIGKVSPMVKKDLEKIAKNNGNILNIRFVGEVEHDKVIEEMLQAGIFTLPSYSEGFPNVVLESMACGCANVVSAVGAMPEMLEVNNGEDVGICVPAKNVDSLRNAYEKYLKNPEYMELCGKNSAKRVKDLYSMPIVWGKLKSIWLS